MILDDFVMLGKTVPEPNSDGRVFVCSAGYSRELRSLIRIYPLARHAAPKRWSVNRVPLERNPKDSRPESWKLAGDRTEGAHEHINDVFTSLSTLTPSQRTALVADAESQTVESIQEANARRMSLAFLRPSRTPIVVFEENRDSPDSPQLRLFDKDLPPAEGAKRFPWIPRVVFEDSAGEHRLMVRDWGAYELMRKRPQDTFELGNALHLGANSVLLVGNFNAHRHSWLVISVLNVYADQMAIPLAESA